MEISNGSSLFWETLRKSFDDADDETPNPQPNRIGPHFVGMKTTGSKYHYYTYKEYDILYCGQEPRKGERVGYVRILELYPYRKVGREHYIATFYENAMRSCNHQEVLKTIRDYIDTL